jgi:hypothetical protein
VDSLLNRALDNFVLFGICNEIFFFTPKNILNRYGTGTYLQKDPMMETPPKKKKNWGQNIRFSLKILLKRIKHVERGCKTKQISFMPAHAI